MQARNPWPLLIALLVAGFFGLSAWSFQRAAREASAITDADYYSHGLRFNQTLIEQQTAAALGWEMQVMLADRHVRIRLLDRQRQPVSAAHATLALAHGGAGGAAPLSLTEASAGEYTAQLPAELRGAQTVRVDFVRDGSRLNRLLLLALP